MSTRRRDPRGVHRRLEGGPAPRRCDAYLDARPRGPSATSWPRSIAAWLEIAPTPDYDAAARAAISAEPATPAALRAAAALRPPLAGEPPGPARARRPRHPRRRGAAAERFDLARPRPDGAYLEQLERDELDARRLSHRLARRAVGDARRRADRAARRRPRRPAPAEAFFRADEDAEHWIAAGHRRALARRAGRRARADGRARPPVPRRPGRLTQTPIVAAPLASRSGAQPRRSRRPRSRSARRRCRERAPARAGDRRGRSPRSIAAISSANGVGASRCQTSSTRPSSISRRSASIRRESPQGAEAEQRRDARRSRAARRSARRPRGSARRRASPGRPPPAPAARPRTRWPAPPWSPCCGRRASRRCRPRRLRRGRSGRGPPRGRA